MNQRQRAVLSSFIRSRNFLESHSRTLVAVANSPAAEALREFIGQVQEYDRLQRFSRVSARTETSKLRYAVKTVRSLMRAIAEIAAVHLAHTPEAAALAHPALGIPAHRLHSAAAAMLDAAQVHRITFVTHGLESDFADTLLGALNELRTSVVNQYCRQREAVGATGAIASALESGRRARRTLDSLMQRPTPERSLLRGGWKATMVLTRSDR